MSFVNQLKQYEFYQSSEKYLAKYRKINNRRKKDYLIIFLALTLFAPYNCIL